MNTPFQNQPLPRSGHRKRVLLATAGLLLLTVAAALIILNALGITSLPSTWSNALALVFATVGAIAAFGTWLLPITSMPTPVNGGLSDNHIQDLELAFDYNHELEIFRQQVEDNFDKRLGRGGLIICSDDNNVGHEVSIVNQISWVRHPNTRNQLPDIQKKPVKRVKVNNGYICVTVYRNLNPDDYIVWIDINQSLSVPVFSNEVTVADLR